MVIYLWNLPVRKQFLLMSGRGRVKQNVLVGQIDSPVCHLCSWPSCWACASFPTPWHHQSKLDSQSKAFLLGSIWLVPWTNLLCISGSFCRLLSGDLCSWKTSTGWQCLPRVRSPLPTELLCWLWPSERSEAERTTSWSEGWFWSLLS